MNIMYQVDDFFVRMEQDPSGRIKLTVWNEIGKKIVSDYVSAASLDSLWTSIINTSSDTVVESVKSKLLAQQ